MQNWFYLKKFEMFNWWTFDWEIETFYLDNMVNVVSWANWSWKSTVVDAMVSLLVPNNHRKYNLSASEAWQKKSRNEKSYVLWAYKNNDWDDWVEVEYLRWNTIWESTFSVILWYFEDKSTWKQISLATFFRNTINWIDKFFIISDKELFIKEDFIKPINSGSLKSLKQHLLARIDIETYTTFSKYQENFIHIFWIRDNAINLFNKVVSLKEIKDLNYFFRENMLDVNPIIEEEFLECEKNYLWVKDIYSKIVESERKLEILTPFIENKNIYEKKKTAKLNLDYLVENINNYSNSIELDLINNEKYKYKESLNKIIKEIEIIQEKLEQSNDEKISLQKLIDNDDITKRIEQLETDIKLLEKDNNYKKDAYTKFKSVIDLLELTFLNTKEDFSLKLDNISDIKVKLKDNLLWLEKKEIKTKTKIFNLDEESINTKKELEYYKKRWNILPQYLSNIRELIIKWTWIDESELPFICELIRVKDSENSWKMPLEKLLHWFWQEMLLSEDILKQVNDFVSKNNLKGKLKYNKISNNGTLEYINKLEKNTVFSKLDIKHLSKFWEWIKYKLQNKYNYICLENTEDKNYYNQEKVLTISWLIKNRGSYLKDDRFFGISKYILGWDTKYKIDNLEMLLLDLDSKLSKENIICKRLIDEKIDIDLKLQSFIKIQDIKIFNELDYFSIENQLKNKSIEIEWLNNNYSPKLQKYTSEIEKLKNKMYVLDTEKNNFSKKEWILENDIQKIEKKEIILSNSLKNIDILLINTKFNESKYWIKEKISFDIINWVKTEKLRQINIRKSNISDEINTLLNKMNKCNNDYVSTFSFDESNEYKEKIWDELWIFLEKEYHRINDEELYKYKEQFEKEFKKSLFVKLHDFYKTLEWEVNNIKTKISNINSTLKNISYSKNTYIEISLKDNNRKSDNIVDFKRDFNEKVINNRNTWENNKFNDFIKIKDLMEKLINKDNEVWKNKVIDIRNWFLFTIKEKYIKNDEIRDVYESSSWKSWWQTIKLAYSILASALLYQYWIKEEDINLMSDNNSKSFRLVLIDEVFAKLDLDNSRYVLDLFWKLWFQLFIVTPTNTLNVLEDYVNTIYFISNPDRDKSFKNKVDIVERSILKEKIRNKDEVVEENRFLKKEDKKIQKKLIDMQNEFWF